jgi:hypothetical protein
MQTPRSLRLPQSARPRSVRRAHAAATLTLSFALVVALASCDEKAPTSTDEPVSP